MSTVTITEERVLEAAAKCSTAKAVLQTLFPEVFEKKEAEKKTINTINLLTSSGSGKIFTQDASIRAGFKNNEFMQVRISGELAGQGFYLQSNNTFDWKLTRDWSGALVLIPYFK